MIIFWNSKAQSLLGKAFGLSSNSSYLICGAEDHTMPVIRKCRLASKAS